MSLNLHLDDSNEEQQVESEERSFSESNNSRFNSVVEPELSSDVEHEEFVPEKTPRSRALPEWMKIPSPQKKRKPEDVELSQRPKKVRKIEPGPKKEKTDSPKKSPKKPKAKPRRRDKPDVGCPERLIKREKHYIDSEDNVSPKKYRRTHGFDSSDDEGNNQPIKRRGPSQRKSRGTRVIYDLLPQSLGSSGDITVRKRSTFSDSFEDDSIEDQDFDSRVPSESSEEIQESPIENSSSSSEDNNQKEVDQDDESSHEIVFNDQNNSDQHDVDNNMREDIDFSKFLNFRSNSNGKIAEESESSTGLKLEFASLENSEDDVGVVDSNSPDEIEKAIAERPKEQTPNPVQKSKSKEPEQLEQKYIVVKDTKKLEKLFTSTPSNVSKAELESFVGKFTASQLRQVLLDHNEKPPIGAKKFDLVTMIVSSIMRRVMNRRKYFSTDQMIKDYLQKRSKQEKIENKKKAIEDLKKKKRTQKEIKWLRAQYKKQRAEQDLRTSMTNPTSPHVRSKIRFEDEQK